MGECGGFRWHAGHSSTQHAELGYPHDCVGSLEVFDDRLGNTPVNIVDEHGTTYCGWVVAAFIRRVDLWIRHWLHHIGNRRGERSERSDDTLSGLDIPGIYQHGKHNQLSMLFCG